MKLTPTNLPSPGADRPEGKPLFILVEDDLDDCALFQRALHKAGITFPVLSVPEAHMALETLLHLGPDVTRVCLVSDSKLPDMSGLDLLKRVKEMVWPVPVKFAFLTGNSQPFIASRARDYGADAFFVKPCASEDLVGVAAEIAKLLSDPTEVPFR